MARAHDFFVETSLPESDLLGHQALVREIAEVLLTARTPLTVMVNGSWGTGKTTFLRSLSRHIGELSTARRETQRAATLWFNPWEHEGVQHIMVPFINALRERAYRDDPRRRDAYTPHERSLLAELLWMFIPDELHPAWWRQATVHPHDVRRRLRAMLSRRRRRLQPPIVEDDFSLLDKPREQLSSRLRALFIEYIDAIRSAGYQRLVIFLDDLDRCRPKLMLDLLDLVKVNLVGSATEDRDALVPSLPVVFVFAIDHQTVIRAVREPQSATPSADYSKYLDKIFNFRFSLPRVHRVDVKTVVARLIDSRLEEWRVYLRRPIGEGAYATSLERALVTVAESHQDLRTVRVLSALINKLMALSYVRRVEETIVDDELGFGAHAGSVALRLATELVVAWHAFAQTWLSTLEMALWADGLGLKLLRGLHEQLQRPSADMPTLLVHLERHDLSASGIRFVEREIISRLERLAALRRFEPTPSPTEGGADGRDGGHEMAGHPPAARNPPDEPSADRFSGLATEVPDSANADDDEPGRAQDREQDQGQDRKQGDEQHREHEDEESTAEPSPGEAELEELRALVEKMMRIDSHVRRAPH